MSERKAIGIPIRAGLEVHAEVGDTLTFLDTSRIDMADPRWKEKALFQFYGTKELRIEYELIDIKEPEPSRQLVTLRDPETGFQFTCGLGNRLFARFALIEKE